MSTFGTIVADADWQYSKFGQKGHGAARSHYPGSSLQETSKVPVDRWANRRTTLLHWVTFPKLDLGVDVMRAWGFSLVTAFPWLKTVPHKGVLKRGMGYWGFMPAELLLVCRKPGGKCPDYKKDENGKFTDKPFSLLVGPKGDPIFYAPENHDDHAAFFAPRGPHSRKPLSLFEWIESYLPGPYLELYATGERPGWTCLGHRTGWHLDERGATRIRGPRRVT